jgi:hypothetical protein
MRRDVAFLAFSLVWVGATCVSSTPINNPCAGAAVAMPLIFVLPGAALLNALRITVAGPGRYALIAGLSMALTVLCGLGLATVGLLTPRGWLVGLSAVTVAGAVLALRRDAARIVWRRPSIRLRHTVLLAATLGVAAASVVVAVRNTANYLPFAYTDFWMVLIGQTGSLYTIGIRNAERLPERFTLRVMVDGAIVAVFGDLTVAPDETVSRTVTLPAGHKAEAWLLRGSDPVEVYRKVSASLNNAAFTVDK